MNNNLTHHWAAPLFYFVEIEHLELAPSKLTKSQEQLVIGSKTPWYSTLYSSSLMANEIVYLTGNWKDNFEPDSAPTCFEKSDPQRQFGMAEWLKDIKTVVDTTTQCLATPHTIRLVNNHAATDRHLTVHLDTVSSHGSVVWIKVPKLSTHFHDLHQTKIFRFPTQIRPCPT